MCVCVCVCVQSSGSQEKRIEVFPGGTHNETWICPGYYEAIISFMVQVGGMSVGGCGVSVASVGARDVCDCSVWLQCFWCGWVWLCLQRVCAVVMCVAAVFDCNVCGVGRWF